MSRPTTHFLHIGKTGGSAIKAALQPFVASHSLRLHGHETALSDVPDTQYVIFFARNPVSRFVSGFNSRLRMGRPRYNVPWSAEEHVAFERFRTPNDLAEALSTVDPAIKQSARDAMEAIQHLRWRLEKWLGSQDYVRSRFADILHIGFQETLTEDFDCIKKRLGLPTEITVPSDAVAAHVTPPGYSTTLSAIGRANIEQWYALDSEWCAFLGELRSHLMAR